MCIEKQGNTKLHNNGSNYLLSMFSGCAVFRRPAVAAASCLAASNRPLLSDGLVLSAANILTALTSPVKLVELEVHHIVNKQALQ